MCTLARPVVQILKHRRLYAHGTFHLKGGMGNMVLLHENFLYPAQDIGLPGLVLRVYVDVCRQSQNMGADGPDIEVVNVIHPFHFSYCAGNLGRCHSSRHPFQQDMGRFPNYTPGPPENDKTDTYGYYRVKHVPMGKINNNAADDYADRCGSIPDHVEECTPDVQVVVGILG